MPDDSRQRWEKNFERNKRYVKLGEHSYNTTLPSDQEKQFRSWVEQNKVPFDPNAGVTDYDMRGFWRALQAGNPVAKSAIDPNDSRMHYPDYWKTPYHQTFSNESQWATPDAPKWNDKDQLIASDGSVIFDDRAQKMNTLMQNQQNFSQMMGRVKPTTGAQ